MKLTEVQNILFDASNPNNFKLLDPGSIVDIAKFKDGRIVRLSVPRTHIFNIKEFTHHSTEHSTSEYKLDSTYYNSGPSLLSITSDTKMDVSNSENYYPIASQSIFDTATLMLQLCQIGINQKLSDDDLDIIYNQLTDYINASSNVELRSNDNDNPNIFMAFEHLKYICQYRYPLEYIADVIYNFMFFNTSINMTNYTLDYCKYMNKRSQSTSVIIYAYVLNDNTVGNLWFIYPMDQLLNPFGIVYTPAKSNFIIDSFEISDIIRNLAVSDYICDSCNVLQTDSLYQYWFPDSNIVLSDKSTWNKSDSDVPINPLFDINSITDMNVKTMFDENNIRAFNITIGYHINHDYCIDLQNHDFNNLISYVWLMYYLVSPCIPGHDQNISSTPYNQIDNLVSSNVTYVNSTIDVRSSIIADYNHNEVLYNDIKIFPFLGKLDDSIINNEQIEYVEMDSFIKL